jgi:hypothetical protein
LAGLKAAADIFGLSLALLLSSEAWAFPAELTAWQIAEKARDKEQQNLAQYGATPCRIVELEEELNEKGAVEERERKILQVPISRAPVPGGKESSKIIPESGNLDKEKDTSVLDHLELMEWRLEAEDDDSPNEPCYRLAFFPKQGGKAQGTRQAVLAQSRGRCWVAKSDFSKIRLEGRLTQPVELMGFLVTVHEVDFLTTTQRVRQGIAAPRQVQYRFRVKVFPFFEFHERHTQTFEFSALGATEEPIRSQKGGGAGRN